MSFRISAPPLPLRLAASLAACLAVFAAVGCSKVSPVAPSGTTITLSASPSFISSGSGSTTITAVVRKPNGTPVANGTEVRFTTDLGSISPIVATTSSSGVATATLSGDGRLGKATVGALVGGGATATTLAVNIGGVPSTAKSITLQVNPPAVTLAGDNTLHLVAVVRDTTGAPVDGVGVTFGSPVGTLASKGTIVPTKNGGVASDTLTVTPADLTNQAGSFTVTANTIGADGGLLPATFSVQVNSGIPHAEFTSSQSPGTFRVIFTNQSTPITGVTYLWDFGDTSTSTEQSPIHTYAQKGLYHVTLQVTVSATGQQSSKTHDVTVN
jgi:hypothetical protein